MNILIEQVRQKYQELKDLYYYNDSQRFYKEIKNFTKKDDDVKKLREQGYVIFYEFGDLIIRTDEEQKTILEERWKAQKEAEKVSHKRRNFLKRVMNGSVEESIRKHIAKHYPSLAVKHSRSVYRSESFYIVDESGEKILKLSTHNTPLQEHLHGTPFLNLTGYTSTINLKKDLDKILSELLHQNEDTSSDDD